MNIYICTDHECHYVGAASVIVAPDETTARRLLVEELRKYGLIQKDNFTLQLVSSTKAKAYVLHDGDY